VNGFWGHVQEGHRGIGIVEMSQLTPQDSLLNLDVLEGECTPNFVIKVGSEAIDFEILYCNEVFRKGGFREALQEGDRKTLQFQSWSQAVGDFKETFKLGNVIWTAEIAGKDRTWKIVRANDYISKEQRDRDERNAAKAHAAVATEQTHHIDRRENFFNDLGVDTVPSVRDLPGTNLHARWETLQAIMEMSDVGVFEYTPAGVLIHGNNAWYKLSSHPREIPAHTDFSFIDLVYPDDRAIVMSAWNTLIQGKPVTFEMRWKGRPGSEDVAQWVLSSCLPVYENGQIFSIAGNTIDINAQKKTQEAAIAQVKALELARKSERKFTRFAQLAPIAIYIFSEGSG
jgi:PAS domain-containing protein